MTATLFYSLGSFIPSLQAEFGWSRGDISLAVTLMTLAMFVSGASAGRLCDRYGAANVGAASLVAYALGVVLLVATASSIKLFWALRSEEHTSDIQSLMRISYAVVCLEKKKN